MMNKLSLIEARPRAEWLRESQGPLTDRLTLVPAAGVPSRVPRSRAPESLATTICGYCSTGCALNVHLRDGAAVNVSATPGYPVNLGAACPKGWEALTPLAAPDRATRPWLRDARTGRLEPVDWDHALQVFTLRFKALLDQHGPDSVAWLGTGQIPCEELAFLGALAKFGMGWRHGDGNTRQCMATAVTAYKESFGFDAPPYTYADLEESDALIFVGANPCIAHPILWQRVMANRRSPAIVVIDPRTTETALSATQHLALRPKSDLVLLYGVARALVARGAVNRPFIERHTTGFEEFAAFVQPFTPETVHAATGLEPAAFAQLVETIATRERVSFWWTMGVNQGHQSTRTAQAIINLALLTGQIGRPGTGANSITGQCNAMGSRLFSNTTNLIGGHDFANPAHREKVAATLGLPVARIPTVGSWAYDQILDGIDRGVVKGLWVVATNPAHSWIGNGQLRERLAKLEFLVVQDMYATTETAQLAHLVLPAAATGEKEGTFINSERRLGVVKKVARAPGEALADFHIFRLIAHYWGCEALFHEWTSPQAVFQILKRCTAGQPCDLTGVEGYRHIEACGGIQWPWSAADAAGRSDPGAGTTSAGQSDRLDAAARQPAPERRLFADGRFFHADSRARFLFEAPAAPPEQPDAEFPFILLTGRGSSAQWHTLTRTDKSDMLRRLSPATLTVEVHPGDAERLGLRGGAPVRVVSRRGATEAQVAITATVQRGQVFLPMHFAGANLITLPVFDPRSRQPAYKFAAVRLERMP